MPTNKDKMYFNRKEAALYLSEIGCFTSHTQLRNMAANDNAGNGPPYNRIGWNRVSYYRSDLDTWAKRRMERVE